GRQAGSASKAHRALRSSLVHVGNLWLEDILVRSGACRAPEPGSAAALEELAATAGAARAIPGILAPGGGFGACGADERVPARARRRGRRARGAPPVPARPTMCPPAARFNSL